MNLEKEAPESLKGSLCLASTIENLSPIFLRIGFVSSLEDIFQGTIEGRFLPNRTTSESFRLHIPELEAPVGDIQRELSLNLARGGITDKKLKEYGSILEFQRRQIGIDILDRAQEFDILEAVTLEDFANITSEPEFFLDKADYHFTSSHIERSGWEIYQDIMGNFRLVMPQIEEGKLKGVMTVNLDSLHEKDSNFVSSQLLHYHLLSCTESMVSKIDYTHQLHSIDPGAAFPDLVKLPQLFTPADLANIMNLYKLMGSLRSAFIDNIGAIKNRFGVYRNFNERSIFANAYFSHMSNCQDADPSQQRSAKTMSEFIDAISSIRYTDQPENLLPPEQKPNIELFRHPERFTEDEINTEDAYLRKELKKETQFHDFFREAIDITSEDDLLKVLEQKYPTLYQKLESLKEVINGDTSDDRFEYLVRTTSQLLSFEEQRRISTNVSERLGSLREILRRGITRLPYKRAENSPLIAHSDKGYYLTDKDVEDTIILICIKRTNGVKIKYEQGIFDQRESIILGLSQRLEKNTQKGMLKSQFLASLNLPADTIDRLNSFFRKRPESLALYCNFLFFHRLNWFNIASDTIQSLFSETFPQIEAGELNFLQSFLKP